MKSINLIKLNFFLRVSAFGIILGLCNGCPLGGSSSNSTENGNGNPGGGGGGGTPGSGGGNSNDLTLGSTTTTIASPANNVMTVTVNGSQCGSEQYPNEPCVEVTLCQSGTSSCQTISNILLDTGSFGLRIFGSLITVPTTPVSSGGGTLAECVSYGDGSSDWGSVETVDVKLGGEPAVAMPIQVINSTFASTNAKNAIPGNCTSKDGTPDTSPSEAGFNGIMGVGVLTQDCGADCVNGTSDSPYYSCAAGEKCVLTTVPLANQVTNPVSLLPVDNNGLILQLPSVSAAGATSLTGALVLGIGTESNNMPGSGLVVLGAAYNTTIGNDTMSSVESSYSSTSALSFIDSGTNYLGIPPPTSLASKDCCIVDNQPSGFFCPSSTTTSSVVNTSATSSVTGTVNFSIANPVSAGFLSFDSQCDISGGSLLVQPNIATNVIDTFGFAAVDWGLPFFYGQSVYVGFLSATSSLGTGPYWAY